MSDNKTDPSAKAAGGHTAGAFDIRNIIGALLGIYGVLTTVGSAEGRDAMLGNLIITARRGLQTR